jgi:putative exporter of polyketide antibiotics
MKKPYNDSVAAAMSSVCCSVATNAMVGALFIRDPGDAAKSLGDSLRWQMAGVIATLGDPEAVLEFLRTSEAA